MKKEFIYYSTSVINIKDKNESYYIIKKKSLYSNNKKISFPLKISLALIIFIIFLIVCIILNICQIKSYVLKEKRSHFIRVNYTREEALIRGRHYLNICLEDKLIKNIKFKKSENPKITVIVPIYNSEKFIRPLTRSIQNQNMIDIEIIFVNDLSTDNSLKIIEDLIEEDPRIKLINNEKNMGILYSRSIAVLEAKGKYILNLDHDDFFLDSDVFEYLYEEAEDGNFDIISFMEAEIKNLNANVSEMDDGILTYHKDGLIVKQPELTYFPFFKNESYTYIDICIWGKLYRSQVYKKAVNLLGKERYSVYNAFNEDQIALFAICSVAKSYKYVRKYGLFHRVCYLSSLLKAEKKHSLKMQIFFTDVVFDLSKNENKKYGLFMALSFNFKDLDEDNKLYLQNVLKKILESQYIK